MNISKPRYAIAWISGILCAILTVAHHAYVIRHIGLVVWSVLFEIVIFCLFVFFLKEFAKYKQLPAIIKCNGYRQFCSLLYFNVPDKYLKTLWGTPERNAVTFSMIGFAYAILFPIMRIIYVIPWVLYTSDRGNFVSWYYTTFGDSLIYRQWPVIVFMLVVLIILSIPVSFCWNYWEYSMNKKRAANTPKG